MRVWLVLLLAACGPKPVQRLNPRDPRLPADAGSWLADAEDEVAITAAKVDDAKVELSRTREYSRELLDRIRKAGSKAQTLERQFGEYTDARIELKNRELLVAQQQYDLAWGRLKEARAETAVRYDLAVYDLAPINAEVEALRDRVGGSDKYVEEQRAQVQKLAGQVWQAYAQYVQQGGDAIALWGGEMMFWFAVIACGGKTETGPAEITVDYSPVDLGVVGLPIDKDQNDGHFDMQFTNSGGELLTVDSVTVKGDYRCSFSFEPPDATDIATTESMFVRGYYVPSDEGEDQIAIHVTSNAKDYPDFVVSICGTAVPEAEVKFTTAPECTGPIATAADCPDNATLL